MFLRKGGVVHHNSTELKEYMDIYLYALTKRERMGGGDYIAVLVLPPFLFLRNFLKIPERSSNPLFGILAGFN